jgi:RelA/SpoT family (p)ppGpp synthetase
MPPSQIQKLLRNKNNPALILEAFEFAKESYKDKQRLSGENYVEHALRVALMLDKMSLDQKTIIFALLHDVIDDKPSSAQKIELEEIEKMFGKEIAGLIEKISGLRKIRYSLATKIKEKRTLSEGKIENLRKTFIALAGDLRVLLVELVSRLDSLGYIKYLAEDQQKVYALETLEIFVPIANRLGLGEIRRKLEDMSFYNLLPEKYKWLETKINEEYEQREKYLKKFLPRLKKILKKERIKFSDINYRAKSFWSTYRKLLKKDMDFEKIHDLLALRIIVDNVETCYKTLGIIHKHFKPISEEINDYIAKPKENGYRSLHTNIFYDNDKIIEVQIRTEEMQKEAEYGICAHWSYKENINLKKEADKFNWLKEAPDFWKSFKIDFFENQVFTFTPKGDIIILPKGSSPVDFAYSVHSDIGNHCESAKIGGKIVPLSSELENGDIIEIITNKKRKPSQDWLKFVKTNLAQSHIKKSIGQQESIFKLPIPHFIRKKISEIAERVQKKKEEKQQIKKEKPQQIYLAGQKGMLVNIAKCCNPEPGDNVKAYITTQRAAVLHKVSCENFQKLAQNSPEKIIDASWE